MKKYEEFLAEGSKIQIKRKYTENHPAHSVGTTARVRNEVLKAMKDGVLTEEEFTKIISKVSKSPNRWKSSNSKYFFVSEEGVKLSKWGLRILSEIDVKPTLKAFPIHEASVVMDAMDPKSKDLKKLLKKNNVEMSIVTMKGPSGWPEVELTGSKEDLQTVLGSEYGWDDPELGEYIEESKEDKVTEGYEVIFSDGISQIQKFKNEKQALAFMSKEIETNSKLKDIAVYNASSGFHSTTQTEYVVKFWGKGSYLDNVSKKDSKLAAKKLEEKLENNTIMENTFLHESFADFTASNGILNEALGSQLLTSVLSSGKEGKYAKQNLKQLAGGFYQLAKVALDKVGDEDMIVSNEPSKVFKENGGSKHILFFISDTEKDNPYCPYDAGYGSLKTVPGGGTLIAAMSGDREFYTNDWSRWSKDRAFKKDGKKGKDDQVGVGHKYRGWNGTGLNNGKRIAEVSDRVVIINLDLIRQKYSTQQLRDARAAAKAGATAFKSDKDFKKANNDRYHQILATKAATMPLDKMVADAIDMLTDQIKTGLAKNEKTKYDEIKIGQSSNGREVKMRDASNHMSNILDDYSRYCNYVAQEEESEKRYGSSESWYTREIKNYALSIKERVAKIEGFDYAW